MAEIRKFKAFLKASLTRTHTPASTLVISRTRMPANGKEAASAPAGVASHRLCARLVKWEVVGRLKSRNDL